MSPRPSRRLGRAGAACVVVVLNLGLGHGPALAEAPADNSGAASPSAGLQLNPTTTCPQDAVAELNKAIEFVRAQAWTDRPGSLALNVAPDLNTCRVVLHIGELSDEEEAALQAGAGSRLAIEYRRDWARPSRLLLILWIIFGGSGVVWVYWRYRRA